jgi:ferrous iron transport protein B
MHQVSFKAGMYVKKAGTIILAASVLIWIATNYPKSENITADFNVIRTEISQNSDLNKNKIDELIKKADRDESAAQIEQSIAGRLGKITEPLIKPLGFDWKIGVALTAGLAAKEIIVSTMNTIYSLEDSESSGSFTTGFKEVSGYSTAAALALMIFVLLYAPCVAASVVFHRESGRWKYTILMFSYTMSVAWIMSFIVYRIGLLVF